MSDTIPALALGAAAGVLLSAPPGPVTALCIRHALASRTWHGFAAGSGSAFVDILLYLLLLAGQPLFDGLPRLIERGLVGIAGLVLILSSLSAFRRSGEDQRPTTTTPAQRLSTAFLQSLVISIANPLNMAGISLVVIGLRPMVAEAPVAALFAGLSVGTIAWWGFLSRMTTVMAKRLTPYALSMSERLLSAIIAMIGVMLVGAAILDVREIGPAP